MSDERIKALLIEDDTQDAELVKELLLAAGRQVPVVEWADKLEVGLEHLISDEVDVVLLDLFLSDGQGLETFERVRSHAPQVPIVVLSGLDDEEFAVRTVQMGAQDYLVKGQVSSDLLIRVIRYAIERQRAEYALQRAQNDLERRVQERTAELQAANEINERVRAEEKLEKSEKRLVEAQRIAHLGNWEWDIVTNELHWSDEIYRIFGLSPKEFGMTYEAFIDSVHLDDRELVQRSVDKALYENTPYSIDHRIVLPDGPERVVHEQAEVTSDESEQPVRMVGTVQDITERKRVENKLLQRAKELNVLNTLGRQVSATLSLEQVVQAALAGIAGSVAPDLAMLFLKQGDKLLLQGVYPEIIDWQRGASEVHRVGQCLCGLAAGEGRPLYSGNIHADSRCTLEDCREARIRSFAALPLLKGAGVLGVLGVASATEQGLCERAAFLEALAGQIAIGLQNAFLYQQAQRHAAEMEEQVIERARLEDQLRAIYRLGQELTLLRDEQVILQRALGMAADVLKLDAAGCALVDEEAGELEYRYGLIGSVPRADEPRLSLNGEQDIGVAVVQDGKALNVPDTTQGPRYVSAYGGWPSRSRLCVPMKSGGRVIGVLNVESAEPNHFTPADQQLMQTLADQTAVALENNQLYRASEGRAARLATLNRISAAAVSSLDPDVILPRILELTCRFLGTSEGSVLLRDPDTEELIFVLDLIGGPRALRGRRLAPGQGIAGWVAQHAQSVRVGDTRTDARFYAGVDTLTGFETRSLLCAPLLHRDQVTGVIEIVGDLENQFSDDDLSLLEAVSSVVAAAMENVRLYEEQKMLLRERERTQAQLVHSEKMAALGRLIASIAHEINNPLQSMQGCLTLVVEEIAGQQRRERLDRYLDIIGEEIDRISSILRNMRDFYRPARTELQRTDVHAVLESVLSLSGKQLQHSNVIVKREWADGLPSIQANPDHLRQVFLNLVLNAVDAMPQGGTLRVHTARDRVQARGDQTSRPAVYIEFSDTGVGMSPEMQTRVFEPFFTTKEGGSGLGLSISYGIVKSHNGQIAVTSQEGEGATFSILLPVEQPGT